MMVYFSDPAAQRVEEVLTEDLGRLATWIAQNVLRMNLQKTQLMSLSIRCREKEANSMQVLVNEETSKKCEEVKYLGVIVDRQLRGRMHVESVRKKCHSAESQSPYHQN